MRIALFTPNFLPETGACTRRIFQLSKGLAATGHEVLVIAPEPSYPHGRSFSAAEKRFSQENTNIEVWRFRHWPNRSGGLLPRALSWLSLWPGGLRTGTKLKNFKPDLVLAQSPPLVMAQIAAFWAKRLGCAFVLNISDLWPRVLLDLGRVKEKSLLYRTLAHIEQKLIAQASLILGQSEEICSYVKEKAPTKEVLCYRNGINPEVFPEKHKTQALVYAGLLGVVQGVAQSCTALAEAHLPLDLHLYGEGLDQEKLKKISQTQPKIHYHGGRKVHEIPETLANYAGAIIFQQKAIYGTVPSKLYEALAAGCFVFLQGEGEAAQWVRAHRVGFVSPPGDTKALLENIHRWLALPEAEQQAAAARARTVAKKYFTQSDYMADLLRALRQYEVS